MHTCPGHRPTHIVGHPSTLKYRLNRIREVLGHDFTRPEVRFNIELALRLRECSESLAAMAVEQR